MMVDTVPRMVAVLTIVCAVAAFALAEVYNVTREPIAQSERNDQLKAIKAVLPPYDNDPLKEVEKHNYEGAEYEFYVAKKAGEVTGRAVKVKSEAGYSGTIQIMLGIAPDAKITGIYIVKQAETPGLGSRIVEKSFTEQFVGKSLAKSKISVKKDGGDIDQLTGATISPRAVCLAVRQGLLAHQAIYEKKTP